MRPLPEIASRQRGVFTARQAHAAGWTDDAIAHAFRVGSIRQLRRGVYALPAEPSGVTWKDARAEHVVHTVAALLTHPGSLASHASAAVLIDCPLLRVPRLPCLTLPPRRTGSIDDVHLHRAQLFRGDPGRLGPLRLTMPARTAMDCARESGVESGLVVADAVLRAGHATPADLLRVLDDCRGWRGTRAARAVAASADARAESALESRSRLRLLHADLPVPWPQTEIWIDGRFVGRVDFYWDELGVIGEADGWEKYELDRSRLRVERTQQRAYERAGAGVVRWDTGDLADFGAVVAEIRRKAGEVARIPRSDRRWVARPTPFPSAALPVRTA
jgi:putative AbiEi antitoxin of type IV toxin-antitoxin system